MRRSEGQMGIASNRCAILLHMAAQWWNCILLVLLLLPLPSGAQVMVEGNDGVVLAMYLVAGRAESPQLLQNQPAWVLSTFTPPGQNYGDAFAQLAWPTGEPALDNASIPAFLFALRSILDSRANISLEPMELPVYRFNWGAMNPADLQYLDEKGRLVVDEDGAQAIVYAGPAQFTHVQCNSRALCLALAAGVRDNWFVLGIWLSSIQSHVWQVKAAIRQSEIPSRLSNDDAKVMYDNLSEITGLQALRAELDRALAKPAISTPSLNHWVLGNMETIENEQRAAGEWFYASAVSDQRELQAAVQRSNELENNVAAVHAANAAMWLAGASIFIAMVALSLELIRGKKRAD